MAEVPKLDEFAFVLMAGVLLIFILVFAWTTPTEGTPVVTGAPSSISVVPGEFAKFDFNVNSSTGLSSVNVSASGDITKWVTFNRNDFSVDSGKVATVTTTVKVPLNTTRGVYNGRITVKGSGGTVSFSIAVEVSEKSYKKVSMRIVSETEFPTDFSVSYSKGTDVLDSVENVQIYTGYFSNKPATLTGLLSMDKFNIATGGSVQIFVEDTNGLGALSVYLNDKEIYSNAVGVGEVLIPIDNNSIERSNVITIKANPPSWMFWASTSYSLRYVRFNLDYEGIFAKTFNITLSKNEVDNFKDFDLFYRVKDYTQPLPELMIKVNSQIVFWERPPLLFFDKKLNEDMFGNPLFLKEGANTITLMFEKNAVYSVTDAMLMVEYYSI